ncbi:WbqC family protein [Aeromonas veronii]
MKIAIMQPYLFPYLGYYQLANAVDKFVFYDDVTYIKGGYINRNKLLRTNEIFRFTLPVLSASSNRKINELFFSNETRKILQTIQQSYSKAPFFKQVFPIIESVFCSDDRNVSILCKLSIDSIFEYLGIDKKFFLSSEINFDRSKGPAQKLIDISIELGCEHYINPIGGRDLYDKEFFSQQNIRLSFINMDEVHYKQGGSNDNFIPNLSMIDVLMWNDRETIKKLLDKYILS